MVCDSRVDEVRTRLALFILGLEEHGYKITPLLHRDLAEMVIDYDTVKIEVNNRDELERMLARKLGREFSSQLSQIMCAAWR